MCSVSSMVTREDSTVKIAASVAPKLSITTVGESGVPAASKNYKLVINIIISYLILTPILMNTPYWMLYSHFH